MKSNNNITILVTGAKGMIGSKLVEELLNAGYKVIGIDRIAADGNEAYLYFQVNLASKKVSDIIASNNVDRIINLAALAHKTGDVSISWESYRSINVVCAKNIFDASGDRPVLQISTVDVFGFFGKNERTYLLNKAVYPLRSE